MSRLKATALLIGATLTFGVSGCSGSGGSTTPRSTPTTSPHATPSSTATPAATSTPSPASTASPVPTPQPTATAAALGCVKVAAPFQITCGFAPNAVTISTSEGAPYGDVDFWTNPLSTNETNYGYGPTKVMRLYICLSGAVTINSCSTQPTPTGPLSATMLAGINAGIAAYQGTGIRVMPRFIYNFGPIGAPDAPLSIISEHIDQVAPILRANKDLIFGLEAGFIGTWGRVARFNQRKRNAECG